MKAKEYLLSKTDRDEIDLQKYWQILKRRWLWIAAVSGLTTLMSALAVSTKSPIYQANAQLLFESNPTSSLIGLDGSGREIKSLSFQDDPLDTQVQIMRSIPVVNKAIEELQIKDTQGNLLKPSQFQSNLKVKSLPGTDILDISYISPDPELAALAVNTIMDVYVQNDIQVNRAAVVAAQEFILEQLPATESAVVDAETELSAFKTLYGIVDLQEESRTTVKDLSNLDKSLTDLNADLAESEAKALELQKRLELNPEEAYLVGILSESEGVQEVLSHLRGVQAELTIERVKYKESHPLIDNLLRQEKELDILLQQRIKETLRDKAPALPFDDLQSGALEQKLISNYLSLVDDLSGLKQRIDKLSSAQDVRQSRAQVIPALEKQQRQLERKLQAAQLTYETLLQNLQEAKVLEKQSLGNSRVVSPATVPENPIAPSPKLYIATGAMLGIMLGISAAFLADLLDRSAKTVYEGQEFYDYPLLGVIPAWKKLSRSSVRNVDIPTLVVSDPEVVSIVEAYQALQSNLKFSTFNSTLKTIAVTSSVAGEGKSEVVANLALTLAQLGHKVLIVDGNMRKPMQHNIWNVPNQEGLSNVIAGQALLENVIVHSESYLHLLPVGTLPTNPIAILESQQTYYVLQQCREIYDYIIIDTPAISGLTDTLILGQHADGILLVMQPGLVDIDNINSTKIKLAQSHQNVLGLVANGIRGNNHPDHYYHYNQEYVMTRKLADFPDLSNSVVSEIHSNGVS